MRAMLDFYTIPQPGWPPMNMVVYNVLLVGCCAYALRKGGAPEKIGAVTLAVASWLTVAALSGPAASFRSIEIGVLLVDLVCAAAFIMLALRAERFWPLWVAAFQVLGTAGHAVKYVDPDIIGRAYAFLLAIWAYPMILFMVVGTWRHQQRLGLFGADKSWSPQPMVA